MTTKPDAPRALVSAWEKGETAGRAGATAAENPYTDWRTRRGAVTWARAFRRAWEDGRRSAAECQVCRL